MPLFVTFVPISTKYMEITEETGNTGECWFVVVNPHAGSGRTAREWENVKNALKDNGIPYEFRMTGCKSHATEIAFNAAREGARRFIAVGGDGTIHEVLGGIMLFLDSFAQPQTPAQTQTQPQPIHPMPSKPHSQSAQTQTLQHSQTLPQPETQPIHPMPSEPRSHSQSAQTQILPQTQTLPQQGRRGPSIEDFTLAVIPIGSGNDWIKIHNIPDNISDTVALIKKGSFASQDIMKVTTATSCSYMINIGGVGFDARVCERVNRKKDMGKRGRLLYISSLIHNLFHYRPSPMEISMDGKTVFSGNCFSIAVGIGKYSGGGLRQTPDAIPDDGLADVTVIPPLPLLRIAAEARRLFDGSITKVKELVSGRCRTLTVAPAGADAEIIEVDGEIVGRLPASFDMLPGKIRVLDGNA